MTDAERTRWMEIIDSLRGGAAAVYDYTTPEEEGLDLNPEFCTLLDSEIFLCEDCGWWEEAGCGDGSKCEDCFDEDD